MTKKKEKEKSDGTAGKAQKKKTRIKNEKPPLSPLPVLGLRPSLEGVKRGEINSLL